MTPRERYDNEAWCEEDAEYAAGAIARCRLDPVYFINAFCWTFDPRKDGDESYLPFLLWPAQEAYVRKVDGCIAQGKSLLTVKSRDQGVSWMMCAVFLRRWLLVPGSSFLLGSYNEDMVDKAGSDASLFWKIDFLLENLPPWMKAALCPGYRDKVHRAHLKVEHPVSGNLITGAAPNGRFGRGGRFSAILADEFPEWENADEAWTSTARSTRCRLVVGTPKGTGNKYGELANPRRGRPRSIERTDMDWHDDPRYNRYLVLDEAGRQVGEGAGWPPGSAEAHRQGRIEPMPHGCRAYYPWYEEVAKPDYDFDDTKLAQEVDRDFGRSVVGQVYPQVALARFGAHRYDRMLNTYTAWDFGRTDATAIWWIQWDHYAGRFRAIDYYENSGKKIGFYTPFVAGRVPSGPSAEEYDPRDLDKILAHRDWEYAGHFGDPSGRHQNQVSDSTVDSVLRLAGIEMAYNDRGNSFEVRMRKTRQILHMFDFDEEMCELGIRRLTNYRFPSRPSGSQSTGENNKPVHDANSHGATALEFFCVNERHSEDWALGHGAQRRYTGPDAEAMQLRDGVAVMGSSYVLDRSDYEGQSDRGVTGYGQ